MTTISPQSESIAVTNFRAALADDLSCTTINRVVMAIRTASPNSSIIKFSDMRSVLEEDFSKKTIDRVIMSLKCFRPQADN